MTTKARTWPNNAKELRDQTGEQAVIGITVLSSLLENSDMTETEKLRRIAKGLNAFNSIAFLMMDAGAPISPRHWVSSRRAYQD